MSRAAAGAQQQLVCMHRLLKAHLGFWSPWPEGGPCSTALRLPTVAMEPNDRYLQTCIAWL